MLKGLFALFQVLSGALTVLMKTERMTECFFFFVGARPSVMLKRYLLVLLNATLGASLGLALLFL